MEKSTNGFAFTMTAREKMVKQLNIIRAQNGFVLHLLSTKENDKQYFVASDFNKMMILVSKLMKRSDE